MRIVIILAHPNMNSFNHSIADAANEELVANGHETLPFDRNSWELEVVTGQTLRRGKLSGAGISGPG